MQGIFKKVVVFSLLGIMLSGLGASATEASARHDQDNKPRYEQHDNRFNANSNRDHHKQLEKEQRKREMQQREHRLQKERAQHEREMRAREHREDKDHDNDLAAGLGALALLSLILNNN